MSSKPTTTTTTTTAAPAAVATASAANDVERKQRVRWSKKMSWALRHGLVKLKLDVRADGYVRLADLLKKYNALHGMDVETVRSIVKDDRKQRYSLAFFDGEEYIRANQGHSVKNVIDETKLLDPITSKNIPPVCVHGTNMDAWKLIAKSGLNRMTRNHIHFAIGLPGEKGVISGMRKKCQVYIFVDVQRCLDAGIPFFISKNSVILSPGNAKGAIPSKFFSKVLTPEGENLLTVSDGGGEGEDATTATKTSAKDELMQSLTTEQLTTLSNLTKKEALSALDSAKPPSPPKMVYVVLDFEATCDDKPRTVKPQEIIELPSVLIVDGRKVGEFQTYVKPLHNPRLTDFCTKLTGIEQKSVDDAPVFLEALSKYEKWLRSVTTDSADFIVVTCGDWDLKTMLPAQCKLSGCAVPQWGLRWINIKHEFTRCYKKKAKGMMGMLEHLKLTHIGRHHSGIDDCRNIARILERMLGDGHKLLPSKHSNRSPSGKR